MVRPALLVAAALMRFRIGAVLLAAAAAGAAAWFVWQGRVAPEAQRGVPVGRRASGRSVLLVTIDTLRADALGAYGNTAARTPVLDRLASRGTFFGKAYATAPITLTSHASLLTGLYPPGHGARHNGVAIEARVPTLAETFRAAGARTAAFVSAFPLDRSFGLARGFETYSDRMPRGADGRLANERPGRVAVDETIEWLGGLGDGPFFAWVHLFEPHAPYGDAADGRPAASRYADEVAEADRQVGRLIDALAVRLDPPLIVVTSDHGEAFGERGEIAHSIFVYDTTLRVPLILAAPWLGARGRVDSPVSLVDLAPTIADLAGLRPPDADGVPLLSPGDSGGGDRALYAESFAPLLDFGWSSLRSVRLGRWKYIAAPRPELYDVSADPAESRNVVAEQAATATRLAGRVERISGAELASGATAGPDPQSRQRLQALGYASGSRGGQPGARRDPKDARDLAADVALVASGELQGRDLDRTLRAILRRDPENPQANLRMGHLLVAAGRCSEAEPLFRRALSHGIPGADAHLGIAQCLGARGSLQEALQALEEARRREPENPVVLANIGIAESNLGRHDRAVASLERALQIDPDLHEARFNLALAHARGGRRDAARREARELLARLPPNAPQRAEVERLLRSL